MSLSIDTLETWWREAARPAPLVIFGAGRWGRVWADVAIAARGGADGVSLIARSNLAETQAWHAEQAHRGGLAIFDAPEAAFSAVGGAASAIIASRPRDHARDIGLCLDRSCSALVEKPFLPGADDAPPLLARARSQGLLIGIAAEFSLLPELHLLAGRLGSWSGEAVLHWGDPVAEMRYGAAKRSHDEVPMLGDLLAHAFSVFEVLGPPKGRWVLAEASQDSDGKTGELVLESGMTRCRLVADKSAPKRLRLLTIIGVDGRRFELDFSEATATLRRDGDLVPVPERWAALTSTLRLELGAWQSALRGEGEVPALVSRLEDHIGLAGQLAALLREGRASPRI